MFPCNNKDIYAFEAILYIALHHSTHPIGGKKLADLQKIPPRYLEITMQKFVRAGILRSIRGPRGGYILAKERRKVSVGDIFNILQKSDENQDFGGGTIIAEKVLQPYAQKINSMIIEELHKTTIAMLCEKAYNQHATGNELLSTIPNKKPDFII